MSNDPMTKTLEDELREIVQTVQATAVYGERHRRIVPAIELPPPDTASVAKLPVVDWGDLGRE